MGFFFEAQGVTNHSISLSQVNKESGFSEDSEVLIDSEKGMLGYAISAQIPFLVAVDLSGGMVYSSSKITPNIYSSKIFNYYSVGDYGKVNDFGLHLHADAGSYVFLGVAGEVGFSNVKFTDSERNSQLVKDFGFYYSSHVRLGALIPLGYLIIKVFGQIGTSNYMFNSVKWIDGDKKYRNFSKINYSLDSPISEFASFGVNLTITIPD
jgi:hypothetical protein